LKEIKYRPFDKTVYGLVFSKSWKSALGQMFTLGITQLTALLYGTIGNTTSVVSYQFSLRVLQMITDFSSSPFYSQIPFYNMLMARKEIDTLLKKAAKSMRLSYWVYVVGVVSAGVVLPYVLVFIDSNASFVASTIWALMILGIFGERYGAMHIQLYTTTNHVLWHISSTVTGSLFLLTLLSCYSFLGIYAFPLSFLVCNYGFFAWYNASQVYKTFPIRFWEFEYKVSIPPFLFLIANLLVVAL